MISVRLFWIATAMVVVPCQAYAYIGPGAGISAFGTVIALIAAVVLAIVGFIWYPLKRLLHGRKAATDATTEATKPPDQE